MTEQDIAILASIGENASFLRQVEQACANARQSIEQRVRELGTRPANSAQGFFAEAWHAETFNLDTVLERMRSVAATLPKSTAPFSADILVTDQGKPVQVSSVKSWADGPSSVNAQKGYGEQERLIPTDQMGEAHDYIRRQIAKDTATGRENRLQNAQELENIREKLTDRVQHGEAESQPLGRREAEDLLQKVRRGEHLTIQPDIDLPKLIQESLRSGAVAAGLTMSMALAPRIYQVLAYRSRTGEFPPDVVRSLFQGLGSTAAEAGLRGAVATSLTMSAKVGLLGEIARTLDPTLIGTLTFITVEAAKDASQLMRGELTGELFADSLMRKSLAATAGAYGAAIGQLVIPVPIVGAMIGATVGSIVAQNGYQLLDTLSEAYFRSVELERLAQINVLLAGEWNTFTASYERWQQQSRYYESETRKLDEQFQMKERLSRELGRRLRQLASEDEDA